MHYNQVYLCACTQIYTHKVLCFCSTDRYNAVESYTLFIFSTNNVSTTNFPICNRNGFSERKMVILDEMVV